MLFTDYVLRVFKERNEWTTIWLYSMRLLIEFNARRLKVPQRDGLSRKWHCSSWCIIRDRFFGPLGAFGAFCCDRFDNLLRPVGSCLRTPLLYWPRFCCTCRDSGVTGSAVTPFLLRTVDELLGGKALTASILSTASRLLSKPTYSVSCLLILDPITCLLTSKVNDFSLQFG